MADQSTRDVMLNEWPRLNQITWDSEGKSLFVTSQTVNGTPVVLRVEPGGHHRVLLQGDGAVSRWPLCSPRSDYWREQRLDGGELLIRFPNKRKEGATVDAPQGVQYNRIVCGLPAISQRDNRDRLGLAVILRLLRVFTS
jgi:hypothetical protein